MKLKALLLPVLALLAAGLVACGGDDDSTSETEATTTVTEETSGGAATNGEPSAAGDLERSVKVEIVDFAYDPDPVTIAVGGKITWLNQDSAPHTATAEDESFDTGTLDQGKLKAETFKEAGTFSYICTIHPTMKGTVEVVE